MERQRNFVAATEFPGDSISCYTGNEESGPISGGKPFTLVTDTIKQNNQQPDEGTNWLYIGWSVDSGDLVRPFFSDTVPEKDGEQVRFWTGFCCYNWSCSSRFPYRVSFVSLVFLSSGFTADFSYCVALSTACLRCLDSRALSLSCLNSPTIALWTVLLVSYLVHCFLVAIMLLRRLKELNDHILL